MNEFGNRLKLARLARGYTQEQMSKLVDIGQSAYAKWENGRTEPNFENLVKLADLLEVSLDWLFGRDK